MCTGPSNAEIAALLHIDLPKTGPKSFWQLAQTFPNCGVGKKFYRKVCFAYPLPCCDSDLTHVCGIWATELACGGRLLLGSDTGKAEGEQRQVSRRGYSREGVGNIYLEWYAAEACLHATRSQRLKCTAVFSPVQGKRTVRSEKFGAPIKRSGNISKNRCDVCYGYFDANESSAAPRPRCTRVACHSIGFRHT